VPGTLGPTQIAVGIEHDDRTGIPEVLGGAHRNADERAGVPVGQHRGIAGRTRVPDDLLMGRHNCSPGEGRIARPAAGRDPITVSLRPSRSNTCCFSCN